MPIPPWTDMKWSTKEEEGEEEEKEEEEEEEESKSMIPHSGQTFSASK